MKISDLVSQIFYEPPTKVVTVNNPICSKCKESPRSISKVSGRVADYCIKCKREYTNNYNAKRKREMI